MHYSVINKVRKALFMEAFLGTAKERKVIDIWIDRSYEPINPNGMHAVLP
jgi:hypothetical protein